MAGSSCEDIVVVEYPCRLIYVILYNPVRVVLSILYYYIYYYIILVLLVVRAVSMIKYLVA